MKQSHSRQSFLTMNTTLGQLSGMKYCLFGLILYAANLYANNSTSMNDYAKGIELVTEKQTAIYRLALPEEIYRTSTKKDLSDIRVFNNNDEPIPHIIRHVGNESVVEESILDLPYFPLPDDALNPAANAFDITVSNEGKVIRIHSKTNAVEVAASQTQQYLIDASHVDMTIDALEFQLDDNAKSYTKSFKLDYSYDLNQWSTLVNRATLTHLEYGNHILKNTRVDLPNKKIKYLRLTCLDDTTSLNIRSIKASMKNQHSAKEKHWSTAKFLSKDNENAVYEFDTGGVFNVDKIDLVLAEENTLIDVIIESRPADDADWRRRSSGIFYKLHIRGNEISGSPINIPATKDRFWRIKLQSTDGIGQLEPVFKYSWRAHQLYFLARGEAPYFLVYGNASIDKIKPVSSQLRSVMDKNYDDEMIGVAEVGRQIILKGDAALSEKMIIPWERIILWLVLATGVFVIAFMVFRLFKQMQTNA